MRAATFPGANDGPYAEDLELRLGQPLAAAPAVTLDAGLAACYQSIIGDPAALALSSPLAQQVTGSRQRVANSGLVLQVVIGQSTVATRRVVANLCYRGVRLLRPVRIGDTITTTVTPLAIEYTRSPNKPRRGKVLLDILASDEQQRPVASMQRLALIATRAGTEARPHESGVGGADLRVSRHQASLVDYLALVPPDWNLDNFAAGEAPRTGWRADDAMHDTVTSAPELARLTLNQAFAHRDPAHGQQGRLLVYGGHVVGLAQASLSRLIPGVVCVLGWDFCDHLAPAFERDVISFDVQCVETIDLGAGQDASLLRLFVRGWALRATGTESDPVHILDWQAVALVANSPVADD